MRLTITPIGATGATPGGVANAVVDYLEGGTADPAATLLTPAPLSAVGYYADSREGPGFWLGRGARKLGLTGTVTREAFTSILEGRDPATGARLLGAQGSARRKHLAVGTPEVRGGNDEWMYTIADVAALLHLTKADITAWVAAGDRLAGRGDPVAVGWLTAEMSADGVRLISERELARVEALLAAPVNDTAIRAGGAPDDELTVDDAARLLHVTTRYVRRLCATNEQAASSSERKGRRRESLPARRETPGGRWLIRRDDIAAFAARREPPAARVGFDVTLTMEKSIGILTLLTDGPRHDVFLRALRVANQTAVEHLDRHAALTRVQGRTVATNGLVVAGYVHATSRSLDPHPHVHNIVANAVTTIDGDRRTLDARALYRYAPPAAALATAAMRWELATIGIGWRERHDGGWEIDGVSDDAIREFSRRHHDIDQLKTLLAERLGHPTPDHSNDTTAWAATRAAKHAVNPTELLADWQRRAATVGLDRTGIDACFHPDRRQIVREQLPSRFEAKLFEDLAGIDGVSAYDSMFTRGDVLRAVTDWALTTRNGSRKVILPPAEIERIADRFLASRHVIELDPHARTGRTLAGIDDPVYATVNHLEIQADIVARYHNGRGCGAALVPQRVLDKVLARHPTLTDEQRALVTAWCTSGDTIQTAVGRAGTGKTTTMRVVVDAWQRAGHRVVGCAVKGEAARQLANDTGINADTLALLLTRARHGARVLDTRTVVIVDEASTIGDRDLHELFTYADRAGAVVRLIGDPAQHGAVPAGGSYRALLNSDPARVPELTHVFRLHDPAERHAAELVRTGHITQALDHLRATGQLRIEPDEAATYTAMLERWYHARTGGQTHPMVHGRNTIRHLLNTLAQHLLQQDGTINPTNNVTLASGTRLCVGDQVVARTGNRRLHPDKQPDHWLRNGTQGHITTITHGRTRTDDTITVATAHGSITVQRADFDRPGGGLQLAYAVTSYSIQSTTQPTTTSAITPTSNRAELYVDITRGQHHNQLYATHTPVVDATEPHLPHHTSNLDTQLHDALSRPPARTAHSADPDALTIAHLKTTHTLQELQHKLDELPNTRASRQQRARLQRAIQTVNNADTRNGNHTIDVLAPAEHGTRQPSRTR